MEIKGFVIDTKRDKNAVLVMRPNGQTAIVKGSGKHYDYMLSRMEQGDWVCLDGKAVKEGGITNFSEITVSLGQIGKPEETVPVICTTYCDTWSRSGYCLQVSKETWTRMVDAYATAVGKVAAEKITG